MRGARGRSPRRETDGATVLTVKFVSVDGAAVDLRLVAYQFPSTAGAGPDDWDANWLVVAGDVQLADGRRWSFSDPCLTTWEARSMGDWLRAVVRGEIEPADFEGDGEDALVIFTEPNIALSLAARSQEAAVVRVHFSLESEPPWLDDEADMFAFFVELDQPLQALSAAIDGWDRELSSFPAR